MKCDYCGLSTESPLGHFYLCMRNAAKERANLIALLRRALDYADHVYPCQGNSADGVCTCDYEPLLRNIDAYGGGK